MTAGGPVRAWVDHVRVTPPTPEFRAYAHRGGSLEACENSLSAFRRAAGLGFTYLETDVRPTRDGVAVLHHDAGLDRTTDGQGPVRMRTWREVQAVHLADGSTPLRLEELLEELPHAHLTIDAKEAGAVPAIADAVNRSGAGNRVCVTSFSPARLNRLRRLLPHVESGAHPGEVLRLRFGTPLLRALPRVTRVQVPPRAFAVPLVRASVIARARRLGLGLDVWTVDDPAQMRDLISLGVDGIMTDRPSALRDVLATISGSDNRTQ